MHTNTLAQAGTLESMDCLVIIEESGAERSIAISGKDAGRFITAMTDCVNATLDALEKEFPGAGSVALTVQDNGALDIVLRARVEAAYRRFAGRDI